MGTAQNWQRVVAGTLHNVALKTDGTLWAWGSNFYGQVGDGTGANRLMPPAQIGGNATWQSISAGWQHSAAIRTDGSLWAWGSNTFGQVGDGSLIQRNAPVQIGPATGWRSVSAGNASTLAIRADGTLWGWGYNRNNELGLPVYSAVPLLIYGAGGPTAVRAAQNLVPLQLVPNPAHDEVSFPGLSAAAVLRLHDALGRVVRTGLGSRLFLQGLAPGLYVVQVAVPGQLTRTARLVIE